MKILIVGINYSPEIIATGVYTAGLAEGLARLGDDVRVITAVPYYPAWKTFAGWRPWAWKTVTHDEGIRATHCPIYVPGRPTGPKRLLHYASFLLTSLPVAIWQGVRFRPDLVITIAPSLVSGIPGVVSARLAGAKTWLHVQDFEVEAAFATGLLREGSRIGRIAMRFETAMLRLFDRVSTISPQMVRKLIAKGVAPERTYELRNWANLSRVSPMTEPSPLKAELGITTDHVALYSGNLANKQGLEIIPDVARQMADRDDLTFVICGDGPMRNQLEASALGLNNIMFLPLQPLERLNDLLGLADVHLLPQIAGASDLVLPSKLTNMLASGRPVIATCEAGTALGSEVEGAGLLTPPGDAQALGKAIAELIASPELRETLGREAARRAQERWSMETIIAQVRTEFLETTQRP